MSIFKSIVMAIPLILTLNVNSQSFEALEEIVVTAQKKEENLQETPIAITAITESAIDDLDIANVVDLLLLSLLEVELLSTQPLHGSRRWACI